MTPKEKAIELTNKFKPSVRWKLGQENVLDRAKECALIAVGEIIDWEYTLFSQALIESEKYWEEVKQEINNL